MFCCGGGCGSGDCGGGGCGVSDCGGGFCSGGGCGGGGGGSSRGGGVCVNDIVFVVVSAIVVIMTMMMMMMQYSPHYPTSVYPTFFHPIWPVVRTPHSTVQFEFYKTVIQGFRYSQRYNSFCASPTVRHQSPTDVTQTFQKLLHNQSNVQRTELHNPSHSWL